jgi:hypothetical protein
LTARLFPSSPVDRVISVSRCGIIGRTQSREWYGAGSQSDSLIMAITLTNPGDNPMLVREWLPSVKRVAIPSRIRAAVSSPDFGATVFGKTPQLVQTDICKVVNRAAKRLYWSIYDRQMKRPHFSLLSLDVKGGSADQSFQGRRFEGIYLPNSSISGHSSERSL